MQYPFDQSQQETWSQVGQLLTATVLSSLIGIEREVQRKSAGLRTNTLVGIGSALFMLISKFGTFDILNRSVVVLDPSRIAAQIVSGIGFIGGGIIFKQQNEIRGLTTAAAVWLSAAVGAACGAGLIRLASISTALYFVAVLIYPTMWELLRQILKLPASKRSSIIVRYRACAGGLQTLLQALMNAGFRIKEIKLLEQVTSDSAGTSMHLASGEVSAQRSPNFVSNMQEAPILPLGQPENDKRIFDISLSLDGRRDPSHLIGILSQLQSVICVSVNREHVDEEHIRV